MRRILGKMWRDRRGDAQQPSGPFQDEQVEDVTAADEPSSLSGFRAVVAQKIANLRVPKELRTAGPEPALPPMAITPKRKEALVVTMADATVREYVESGQLARLSAALERYGHHFDEVLLVTADRTDYTAELGGTKVRHLRSTLPLSAGSTLRAALAAASNVKSLRHAVAVLALDEPGTLAGRVAARLSGSRLRLSSGAPWSPPLSRSAWSGWKTWPVRLGLSRVEQVMVWHDAGNAATSEHAEKHALPIFIDSDLFCPLETTDPSPPDAIVALIGPDDMAAAAVLIDTAQRLARHKHGVVIRAFVDAGAAGEVFAKSLQAQAEERQSVVRFAPLPTFEVLPDVLARPRVCVSFGSEQMLPHLLSSMSCGVPCVVVDRSDESAGGPAERPDWRDFVLRVADSGAALARGIEAVLREPIVRSRLAREGRRYVVARHSLEAIQRKEAEILRKRRPVAEEPAAPAGKKDGEFDAEAEAAKLAVVLAMTAAINEETAA